MAYIMNIKIRYYCYYWLPVFLYMGLIFYMSSLSHIPSIESKIVSGWVGSNYLKHALEYFILGILLIRASKKSNLKNPLWFSLLTLSIYALSDEFHQIFVPGREFEIFDWFFDFIGGTAGVSLRRAIEKFI